MSYILEALKKAQAERELGSAPTIHAAAIHAAPVRSAASRKPLLIGLGAGALVAGVAAFAMLRQSAPQPQPQPIVVAAAPAPQPPVAAPAPPPAPPVIEAPKPAPKPPPVAAAKPPPPKPAPKPERVETVAVPEPAPMEDTTPPLSQLPEAIQREVPKIAVGGYIYSANPADRLLLIDKVLRREGEEVAPGLVLERLLPKAAVMNYRGYRYRLSY